MVFDKLTQLLSSSLGSKGSSVLGIDIGSSAIKVVQVRREKGAAVLETYGELALGPYADLDVGRATNLPPEKIAEALKDLLREANVTTQDCGASIPFASSLVTLIEMPAAPPAKLNSMIPIEARKYIPVPIAEVQLDWFIVPESEMKIFADQESGDQDKAPQKSLVLLVAIHNEVLRKYNDALTAAGLTPTFYEIEIFSTIRASIERGIAPIAIVDIGAATTKLYIIEFGIVRVTHVINRGAQDITTALASSSRISIAKAEELKRQMGLLGVEGNEEVQAVSRTATISMEYIFSEARRTLLNFQKKHNKIINKVIFTGGGSTIKGMLEFARQQFEVEVELSDPFSKMQAPAFLEPVLKEAGPEFAVAVGLALRKLQEKA